VAAHGGQRVIIVRDGRYLGQYKPDLVGIGIAHGELILMPAAAPGLSREFTRKIAVPFKADGPPWTVWVGGENLEFFK